MKKFFKRTAIVLICLVGLWCILLSLRKPWIEPIPGVRLEPTRPILLEKDVKPDSAFDLLRRAGEAYTVPKNQEYSAYDEWKHMPWSLDGATNTLAILKQSQESLALARRAAEAPDPQVPTMTNFNQKLPYVAKTRAICRCFNMSAKAKTVQGDYSGAFADLRSAICFSSIITRGSVLIGYLVDMACSSMSCKTMRLIVLNYPVQEDVLRDAISFLDQTENGLEPWAECMRYERLFGRSAIDVCAEDPLACSISAKPSMPRRVVHRTIARLFGSTPRIMKLDMDACYTHLVAMGEKPYDQAAYDQFDKSLSPTPDPSLLMTGGIGDDSATLPIPFFTFLTYKDPIGRLFAGLMTSSVGAARSRQVSMIADLRATRIVLAIVMFKRDEGKLPKTLDELTPKYLDKIPDDPFDGKQMKYRVNADGTWVVYSVSYDGKDDGGVEDAKPGSRGKPDLIFGPTETP